MFVLSSFFTFCLCFWHHFGLILSFISTKSIHWGWLGLLRPQWEEEVENLTCRVTGFCGSFVLWNDIFKDCSSWKDKGIPFTLSYFTVLKTSLTYWEVGPWICFDCKQRGYDHAQKADIQCDPGTLGNYVKRVWSSGKGAAYGSLSGWHREGT